MEMMRKKEASKTPRFLTWVTMWVEVPFTDKGDTREKTRL